MLNMQSSELYNFQMIYTLCFRTKYFQIFVTYYYIYIHCYE